MAQAGCWCWAVQEACGAALAAGQPSNERSRGKQLPAFSRTILDPCDQGTSTHCNHPLITQNKTAASPTCGTPWPPCPGCSPRGPPNASAPPCTRLRGRGGGRAWHGVQGGRTRASTRLRRLSREGRGPRGCCGAPGVGWHITAPHGRLLGSWPASQARPQPARLPVARAKPGARMHDSHRILIALLRTLVPGSVEAWRCRDRSRAQR